MLGPGDAAGTAAPLPLHRVRFVDWHPSSITALTFSPTPPAGAVSAHLSGGLRSVLAVGRDNGNIDLCTWCEDAGLAGAGGEEGVGALANGWMVESTLLGDVNYKVESLAFTLSTPVDGHGAPPHLRLFSTSGGSVVTEHFLPPSLARTTDRAHIRDADDALVHGAATRTLPSQGGAIWSMAASPLSRYLAIGCEDGFVRLVDVAGDAFEHLGSGAGAAPRMTRVASRILALAWGPPRRKPRAGVVAARGRGGRGAGDSDSDSDADSDSSSDSEGDAADAWTETFLVGGLGNSTAAVWDVGTGQLRSRLTVLKNRSEHTIVWAVAVLGDGTIATGDSTGRVTFFDARTRVPIPGATFQCHTTGADVLVLCAGSDGRTLYSAGVDQKVAEYALVGSSWVHTGTRRLHAHDIRALAMDPPLDLWRAAQGPGARAAPCTPVLVSGGIDFHLVLTPAAPPATRPDPPLPNPISSSAATDFANTTQRRVPFVPQSTRAGVAGGAVVGVCAARGWVVLRRERSIAIWALDPSAHGEANAWAKLTELQLRTNSNLAAAAVSPNGRFCAVSDLYETKLFDLGAAPQPAPTRVHGLGACLQGDHGARKPVAPGASVLTFTPDSRRLVLASLRGGYVYVVQLPSTTHAAPQLLKRFAHHRVRAGVREEPAARATAGDARARSAVQQTPLAARAGALSPERTRETHATVVLAAVSPDGQWLVTVDSMRHMHVFHLDTLSHQRALATLPSLPTCARFHPHRPSLLAMTLPTNHVCFYDLDAAPDAGCAAPEPWEQGLQRLIDAQLSKIREPVIGCVWIPENAGAPETLLLYGPTWICTARRGAGTAPASRKKRRSSEAPEPADALPWSIRTTFKYQPLLHVGALPPRAPGGAWELLVVERPYFALAQTLPPAFYRGAKYGF
ncbi:U3 small nucleolar RNA-associated protein [Malassezia sp. CBS 17886]|nr:U3 small nucleolar RNA-associated protein [Malassezia sp. CBS 17886]